MNRTLPVFVRVLLAVALLAVLLVWRGWEVIAWAFWERVVLKDDE